MTTDDTEMNRKTVMAVARLMDSAAKNALTLHDGDASPDELNESSYNMFHARRVVFAIIEGLQSELEAEQEKSRRLQSDLDWYTKVTSSIDGPESDALVETINRRLKERGYCHDKAH